ncbi:hypothetical protein [Burkholderia dolosa]|uniref:hypothetical protein n=1 Tax=Burkholderia dolosa TaxID=152500 RepID=UPI001BA121C0|nr:hypothetical protein [Burkholderia dolosa]MBR8057240.1 hypothetical protein [Burkholderia dolosa]
MARLIDYRCDFSLRSAENIARRTPSFLVSKNRFFIPQTIVQYECGIVNLRKGAGCGKSKSRLAVKAVRSPHSAVQPGGDALEYVPAKRTLSLRISVLQCSAESRPANG